MIKSVCENEIIIQIVFKANKNYFFDSLIFLPEVLLLKNSYKSFMRSHLKQGYDCNNCYIKMKSGCTGAEK